MTGCCVALSQTAAPPRPSGRKVYPHTEAWMHHWLPYLGQVTTGLGRVPPTHKNTSFTECS